MITTSEDEQALVELPRSKEVAEVEVESVAYIVCDAFGLDSGDYSFAYVARWAEGSTELITATAERAVACAKMILVDLEDVDPSRRLARAPRHT